MLQRVVLWYLLHREKKKKKKKEGRKEGRKEEGADALG
jgi:hypothetical protein